jgi:predicted N-formylglutamate amidohydrolase
MLTALDPPAFTEARPEGRSPYLVVCDHAGRAIPGALGTLGLSEAERATHIAWDLGAAELARELSDRLDARAILQTYSRLVIDANRPPGSAQSIVALSDETAIPGNAEVTPAQAREREQEIFRPYHQEIASELDRRRRVGQPAILLAVHSFTPCLAGGEARPWHVGVLYHRDGRLGRRLLALLAQHRELVVGDNQPYSVSDETDYTLVVHGERRGLAHAAIELRQDEIASETGRRIWADRLAEVLVLAARDLASQQGAG